MEISHRKYQRVEMTEAEFLEKLGMSGKLVLLERGLPSLSSWNEPRMIRMEFEIES